MGRSPDITRKCWRMPYPVIVYLEGKRCVVVGAGKVAERRVEALRRQGATIFLVAPDASPALVALAQQGALHWTREEYSPAHLESAFLVIAATNCREVNQAVARDAQARNLLVTCADEPDDGNYRTPSVIERGDLIIAVSTGGKSPTLASVLRERLEDQFGPEWTIWTRLFGRIRSALQAIPRENDRKALARRILDDPAIHALISNDNKFDEAEAAARRCILSHSESAMPARP